MSAAYQHLALTEVEPGMIVANELLDQQGQVLLPKGAVLTASTIALLPSHGIDMVGVLRPGALPDPAPDTGAIEHRLAHLFRQHDPANESDWATSMLRLYITDFRLRPGAGS